MTPALAAIQTELGTIGVMAPDDLLEPITPMAALWYARETLVVAAARVALWAEEQSGDEVEGDDPLADMVQYLTTALAGANMACIAIGLLPPSPEMTQ